MSMVRFNLLYCFSKIFFRKRSKASPPNFAPPFCALCLIVCDFLPKTWNLGRKLPLSRCATAPPRGCLNPLSHRCAMPPLPKGEARALPEAFSLCPNTLATSFRPWLSLWGKTSPAPGEDVTAGDKKGNLARERLRGRISLLFVPNSTFWGENRKRLSKMHKTAAQSLAGAGLVVPGRKYLRNNGIN